MRIYCDYISPDAFECTSKAKWSVLSGVGHDTDEDTTSYTHLHKYIGDFARVWAM